MKAYWNFPAVTGGLINSINNAGLETFRGNPLGSLTREICQNSLDAVDKQDRPVIVEFHSFKLPIEEFPGKDELIQAFHRCKDTWKDRNKKSEEFIANALEILDKKEIQFLRISDFNTKGLVGAKDGSLGSPWSSLVREAGTSNKDEISGGSFGIGKAAPFLNSKLRTLFYSSLDIEGYESHIGVANIMSFYKGENEITQGTGYYTNTPDSLAIFGQLFLDKKFIRNQPGTDIYVSAFYPADDWEEEIKKAVLFDFFVTVYQGKLIVKINGFEINQHNIAHLINQLEDNEENNVLKNYFNLLVSKNAKIVLYPEKKYNDEVQFKKGEAVLYLMGGEDLNRRVLVTRKIGMRIFEQKGISGSISFTGLLMITGNTMNNIFKQMENPSHTEWSPERYEKNPKLAKKIYADLKKFIREAVKEHFQEKITDSMDAIGLNEFLPNSNFAPQGSSKRIETLDLRVKDIVVREVSRRSSFDRPNKGVHITEIEKQLAGEYGIDTHGDRGGSGLGSHSGNHGSGAGVAQPFGSNTLNQDGKLDKKKELSQSMKRINIKQKYICLNKNNGEYRFFIRPEKSIRKGRLEFIGVGEQSNYPIHIDYVYIHNPDVVIEKQGSDYVQMVFNKPTHHFTVDLKINITDFCVIEAGLYEN
ncbi:hypothetical protein [Caldibacillus debilis]|uniref:Uncharacterized protein n=1 Tax=Caldibacillus debilis TaxID=301148 RepID=A0A150MBQ7_9BACI|nr:hypothetical protein [Caldibacillus debilis]KYD22007.1 hypothetical protein B4135_1512 [Caldibacillus debilis]